MKLRSRKLKSRKNLKEESSESSDESFDESIDDFIEKESEEDFDEEELEEDPDEDSEEEIPEEIPEEDSEDSDLDDFIEDDLKEIDAQNALCELRQNILGKRPLNNPVYEPVKKQQKLNLEYNPDSLSIHINIPSEMIMFMEDMIEQYLFPFGEFGEFGEFGQDYDQHSDMSSIQDINGKIPKMKKLKKTDQNIDGKRGAKFFVFNQNELNEIKDIKELESLKKLITILDNKNATNDQKKLISALKELDGLIGMSEIKLQIIDQIMFYIQDFSSKDTFLHSVICGPPGVGKTVVAKIMAKIYVSLGFLSSDKVVSANRSKLIGAYLGETAIKTQKLIKEAKGGILFIDEAYSLGSVNGEDSFAKECIDTLNEYLSKFNNDLICIIAGYKEALDKFFFKQNEGLESRFPWRFSINAYSPEELCEIFLHQGSVNGWKINVEKSVIIDSLKKSIKYFNGNGRDTVNLFKSCQLCHSKRQFLKFSKKEISEFQDSKEINKVDFQNGFNVFIKNKKINELKEPKEHNMMYT